MKITILQSVKQWFGNKFSNKSAASGGRSWIPLMGGNFFNLSKQKVNNDSALTLAPVYAAINAISGDTAKLPIQIRRTEGDRRINQPGHGLDKLLNFQANPLMTAMTFRESIMGHALGWGNGYAEIQRDAAGDPVALWLLRPDRLNQIVKTEDGRLVYVFSNAAGGTARIDSSDIFHVHGLGYDGVVGYNVIRYAAEAIGLGLAAEKFGGAFFGNGCNQSGSLKHPSNLTEKAQERLTRQIEKHHDGVQDSHTLLVLEEGMEFVGNLIPPEESQFIETQKFNVNSIARFFRIPPHKIGDLERSTFSNIEQQNIDYVTDSLDPWIKRFELEVWTKLFNESEQRDGYYGKFNVNALLRGDSKTRGILYKTLFNIGVMSPNEIRALEDMNPIDGGDQHFVPMNMVTLDQAGKENNGESKVIEQAEPIVENIASRIAKTECHELEKHLPHRDTDPEKFRNWANKFYEKHEKYIYAAVKPLRVFNKNLEIDFDSLTMKKELMDDQAVSCDVESRQFYIKNILLGALRNV